VTEVRSLLTATLPSHDPTPSNSPEGEDLQSAFATFSRAGDIDRLTAGGAWSALVATRVATRGAPHRTHHATYLVWSLPLTPDRHVRKTHYQRTGGRRRERQDAHGQRRRRRRRQPLSGKCSSCTQKVLELGVTCVGSQGLDCALEGSTFPLITPQLLFHIIKEHHERGLDACRCLFRLSCSHSWCLSVRFGFER